MDQRNKIMKKVKVNTDFERLQLKAREALNFLECHPAMNDNIWPVIPWFSIQTVCKRGYCESAKRGVRVYRDSKDAPRFKKEFDEELKEFNEAEIKQQGALISIDVPYKKLFGEEWKFDHVEYWGELTFYMFSGKPTGKRWFDRANWQGYCGVEAGGRTFEEMIVKITEKFKKAYGDFDKQDFLTKEEKENNKNKSPFDFKPFVKDGIRYSRMLSNKEYKHVNDAELNLRWQKWFKTTENYKKNWASDKLIK
jgi:hypothetical protein